MNLLVAWVILTALVVLAAVTGLRFRQGLHREYLAFYRDPSKPAIWRYTPLVMPLVALLQIPVLVLMVPMALDVEIPELPRRIQAVGIFGAGAYFFVVMAAGCGLVLRPPDWLVPGWLRREDEAIGFRSPPPDNRDLVVAAAGVIFLLIAIASMAVLASELLTDRR